MAATDHKRCLGCGYILDGLPEPRCPECGRGFDPKDSSTYASGDTRRSGYMPLALAMLAGMAFVAAHLSARSVGFVVTRTRVISWLGIVLLEIGAWFAAAWAAGSAVRALRQPRTELRHCGACVVAAILGVVVCLAVLWSICLPIQPLD